MNGTTPRHESNLPPPPPPPGASRETPFSITTVEQAHKVGGWIAGLLARAAAAEAKLAEAIAEHAAIVAEGNAAGRADKKTILELSARNDELRQLLHIANEQLNLEHEENAAMRAELLHLKDTAASAADRVREATNRQMVDRARHQEPAPRPSPDADDQMERDLEKLAASFALTRESRAEEESPEPPEALTAALDAQPRPQTLHIEPVKSRGSE